MADRYLRRNQIEDARYSQENKMKNVKGYIEKLICDGELWRFYKTKE